MKKLYVNYLILLISLFRFPRHLTILARYCRSARPRRGARALSGNLATRPVYWSWVIRVSGMRIFVAGAGGAVGSRLVPLLVSATGAGSDPHQGTRRIERKGEARFLMAAGTSVMAAKLSGGSVPGCVTRRLPSWRHGPGVLSTPDPEVFWGSLVVKRSSKFPCYRHEFAPYSEAKYLKILEVLEDSSVGNGFFSLSFPA
jgi:hypothetical protein